MTIITSVSGSAVPLLLDDIDTDRIIPARFLRCVTFDGLGEHAFEDDRRQDAGHPFNQERFAGASVLLAGRNFGCGSSREHAPQSLMRWGIKAIVAESYAEIFFGNCTALGVPAVTAAHDDIAKLAASVEEDPTTDVTVDIAAMNVSGGGTQFSCEMPSEARDALTTGKWDFLAQLLQNVDSVFETAEALPYMTGFGA